MKPYIVFLGGELLAEYDTAEWDNKKPEATFPDGSFLTVAGIGGRDWWRHKRGSFQVFTLPELVPPETRTAALLMGLT